MSLFTFRYLRMFVGVISGGLGSLLILYAALNGLIHGHVDELNFMWNIPFGRFHIEQDALSQVFAIIIGLIGSLGALYGYGYMKHDMQGNNRIIWFAYNLLVASMLLVVLARNGMLFLMAWELMALSSFFLVIHYYKKPGVLTSGWIYLISSQLGTAFLFVMFLLLDKQGDMEFCQYPLPAGETSLVFLLAIVGFGTKAGIVPFHVWLPEAHPVAPSHVSALMSGVMIKIGIYGILRIFLVCQHTELWWGGVLVVLGSMSCINGVLYASQQGNVKRLLAYSSSENVGIILLGIGLGVIGLHSGHVLVAVLGFLGAVLHIINHAIFKSLLFFSAGSILHATGTSDMNKLGGLIKKMPHTAVAFVVGSASICALPSLNGFVSEFLIYSSAFQEVISVDHWGWAGICIISLALTGGLAAICFTKAFGIIFSGESRSDVTTNVHESDKLMTGAMYVLIMVALFIGLAGPIMIKLLLPAVTCFAGLEKITFNDLAFISVMWKCSALSAIFLLLMLMFALFRYFQQKQRIVCYSSTWGCGYRNSSPRMQYTASSFVEPLTSIFRFVLSIRQQVQPIKGLFSENVFVKRCVEEPFMRFCYTPLFHCVRFIAAKFRLIQQGNTHIYILYIAVTLVVLLLWKLWR